MKAVISVTKVIAKYYKAFTQKFFAKESQLLVLLSIFYFVTRFFHLTILPIFNDESSYIYWSKIIATTNAHWFVSLVDGKPPLLFWIMATALWFFPGQTFLFVARSVSVFAGFFTLLGIIFIGKFLFRSQKAAVIASLLYITSPLMLIYDRLALYDSILCALLLWTTYFTLKTAKTLRFRDALTSGIFLGLSFYTKPTAAIYLLLIPLMFFIALFGVKQIFLWKKGFFLILIILFLGEAFRYSLVFSRGYRDYIIVNARYVPTVNDLMSRPLFLLERNLPAIFSWFTGYQGILFILCGFFSYIFLLFRKGKADIILMLLFLLPLLAFSFVGKILFPRYLLFIFPYFLLPVAYIISLLMTKAHQYVGWAIMTMILLYPLFLDSKLLFNPPGASLPFTEYTQLISSASSGYGLSQVFQFLDERQKKYPITIVTLGTISSYPYAFNLQYWDDKRITIIPIWPVTSTTKNQIQILAKHQHVFVILKLLRYTNHPDFLKELRLKKVFSATKPGGMDPITIAAPD
ncbi:MAG TPA: glycosyltransferase family 39 protein [Patescibacteria group bacterium]|nr:glycosyltransferase family 39 protein [Patescibacteria group bacterium]